MRIEKIITNYGYDLMINQIWHKRCLSCQAWYEFDGELGICQTCLWQLENQSKPSFP